MGRDIYAEYFSWLLGLVGDGGGRIRLLKKMYTMDFIVHPSRWDDENRISDALAMRQVFIDTIWSESDQEQFDYDFWSKNVSVLEVLVSVSVRCETDIMQDEAYGDRTSEWFWGLIEWFSLGQENGPWAKFLGCEPYFFAGRRRRRKSIWAEMCDFLNKMA